MYLKKDVPCRKHNVLFILISDFKYGKKRLPNQSTKNCKSPDFGTLRKTIKFRD